MEPMLSALESQSLTTGLPGNSLLFVFLILNSKNYLYILAADLY